MTVAVNHDYPSENALRVLFNNGEPVEDADIDVYEHTDYHADAAAATVVASTTTDENGQWDDTIDLDDARTWVLKIHKTGAFDTKILEITT